MTLPIANPTLFPVGTKDEGGDEFLRRGVAVLDPYVNRDMRSCVNCGAEEEFRELCESGAGRLGICLGCGEERVVGFTRVTGEVA